MLKQPEDKDGRSPTRLENRRQHLHSTIPATMEVLEAIHVAYETSQKVGHA